MLFVVILGMKFTAFRPIYLPSLEFFWQAAQVDVAVFADHLQYVKRSSITVSAPLTEDREQTLHIPVRHMRQRQTIREKTIDSTIRWRRKHWQSIRHLFHEAPFAYYYLPQVEQWFKTEGENDSLADFLLRALEDLTGFFHLNIKWVRSSKWVAKEKQPNERFLALIAGELGADTYLTNPETIARGWLDAPLLTENGITLGQFAPFPESHLFRTFRAQSALGFLLQFGPEAGYLIRQYLPGRRL